MGLDLTWNSFVPQRSGTIFEGFKFSRNAHQYAWGYQMMDNECLNVQILVFC